MSPGLFHVTASSLGRPVVQGWWPREDVARGTFTRWVGLYSGMPGARFTLVDDETGIVLTIWPEEPTGPAKV